jgi:hypothetical protein
LKIAEYTKAGFARNPRELNHEDHKVQKGRAAKVRRRIYFSPPAGWTPGEKTSTPGGVRPIPEGICKFEQSGMARWISWPWMRCIEPNPALLNLHFVFFVPFVVEKSCLL